MLNPTIQATSQFQKPFNILPDILYTNPTSQTPSQFTAPFNILPEPTIKNPLNSAQSKLQFKRPFNILPDTIFTNPSTAKGAEVLSGLGGVTYRRPQDSGIYSSNATSLVNQEKIDQVVDPRIINWPSTQIIHTNVTTKSTTANILGLTSLIGGSLIGIPQIGQAGQSLVSGFDDSLSGTYTTLPLSKLNLIPGVLYSDFRSRIKIDGSLENNQQESWFNQTSQPLAYASSLRLDGLSAATRGSLKAAAYAAATASPIGAYSIFNLDGAGKSGFGWGEHDNPNAVRKDFTMRSHVAKKWNFITKKWIPTINIVERATPFRGDKINVIDFNQRKLSEAYLWNPNQLSEVLGMNLSSLGITQDFIKFFMTGPNLTPGNILAKDDIIVFRAILTGLDDSFTANWSPIQMIGRADPNYIYTGFGRDMSINFTVYATDRDELQPIYRKLNALAGYTAPTYNPANMSMEGPWMRLTVGDLLVQQPVVLSSLSYTYDVSDAPWEINIENDPTMMQVPLKISVQMQFNVISDYLPQKGGRFYTLAKRFAGNDNDSQPKTGNDNWLSDAGNNFNIEEERARWKTNRGKDVYNTRNKTAKGKDIVAMANDLANDTGIS